jgi:hypothetical protein
VLDEQFVTFGYEPRDRLTFGAYIFPAVVGVTSLRCTDILDAQVDADLTGTCTDNWQRRVLTPLVAAAPAGGRMRFAPFFDRPQLGAFMDIRFLEFGASGFTTPQTEGDDRTGFFAIGSLGTGLDAQVEIEERPFVFYARGGGNLVLVAQQARVRPTLELGVAVPILTTNDKTNGKDAEESAPNEGESP